ncbi:hypothetical protein [Rhizobium sp. K102]|uniref:hypothetical protein n=1 Tax=Rhizobium sp. K102 TaxID=2918527 RepID=UPI001EFA3F37|nr:hypothetical protein [Rhizobium sp. K102]ULR47049.1 hypothetical protein MHI61_29925 [Rhizobium sp. K102]
MKMKYRLAALLLSMTALAGVVSPASAAKFDIDPVHSGIAFYIDHLGFSKVIGVRARVLRHVRFRRFQAGRQQSRCQGHRCVDLDE